MSNDSPASILFDIEGTTIAGSQIVVSTNNSSTTPLAANASFIGGIDELWSYHDIDINLYGEPYNWAPGTLYFEFSPDKINWDVSIPITLDYPGIIPLPLRVILPYFRVRYINGSVPLSAFRLTTLFHREKARPLTRLLSQAVDPNEPIQIMRSILNTQYPDGSYNYLQSNALGQVKVDSTSAQIKVEYDLSSSSVNYIGYAPSGTATSAAVWIIKKINFDTYGNPQNVLWSNSSAVWDNRVNTTYS